MTRKERLLATIAGCPVDRPAVSFYEINGLTQDPNDKDPFNIYSHPSWHPLLDLARDKTDRLILSHVPLKNARPLPWEECATVEHYSDDNGSRHTVRRIKLADRILTTHQRRDLDVNTTWTLEHPLKDAEDLKAWLDLPRPEFSGEPDMAGVLALDKELGDTGLVLLDTADPLCLAAELFAMSDYTIVALTEPDLFRQALERFAAILLPRVEAIARALPGRLWRIYGPEYASPPYLPPALFAEYVVPYVSQIVQSIQRYGGYARIHSHGNLRLVLDHIAATGCDGLDPIEPPDQGDVELSYVREKYGKQLVLFGNLEATDLENLPTADFKKKIEQALREGTSGQGRGFVLMPSACPYGRILSPLALANYRMMVECVENRTY
jgi:uroporphyrinogen-III decarboxylase